MCDAEPYFPGMPPPLSGGDGVTSSRVRPGYGSVLLAPFVGVHAEITPAATASAARRGSKRLVMDLCPLGV